MFSFPTGLHVGYHISTMYVYAKSGCIRHNPLSNKNVILWPISFSHGTCVGYCINSYIIIVIITNKMLYLEGINQLYFLGK